MRAELLFAQWYGRIAIRIKYHRIVRPRFAPEFFNECFSLLTQFCCQRSFPFTHYFALEALGRVRPPRQKRPNPAFTRAEAEFRWCLTRRLIVRRGEEGRSSPPP